MTVQSLQRTDIVRIAPDTFLRVVAAVLSEGDAPTDLRLLLQPLEGGGAKKTTLAAFNAEYPDAKVEYSGVTLQ